LIVAFSIAAGLMPAMASQATQPGEASPANQIEQTEQRALLERAFELAVEARGTENPRWVTTLTPRSKDGLDVYMAVVRDSKGQFYLFASPLEDAVLGTIVPRSDKRAAVKAWFLDGSSADGAVTNELPWARIAVGPVCEIAADLVIGGIIKAVCTKFWTCAIVGSIVGVMICSAEGGEPFRFNPSLKSVDWDSEATGESGVSNVNQCCGSPYYLVVDVHIHANSCHPDDYPNGRREHVVRVCHETNGIGQKTRRLVQWRVSYFWPDGTKSVKYMGCECTLITPPYLYKTVAVPPGEYVLGVSSEEGFEFIGFHGTGSAIRYYHFTP
jgi:hypothetical protein